MGKSMGDLQELIVEKELYMQNRKENYCYLQTALHSLTNASQKQFEEMKNEKWYHRVFDLLTFSKKGKKRVAEQIKTVVQAQQILMQLLVVLSDTDAALFEMIQANTVCIRQLAAQNVQLGYRVKFLEQRLETIEEALHIDAAESKCRRKGEGVFSPKIEREEWNAEKIQKWYYDNVIRENCELHILDSDLVDLSPYHLKTVKGYRNEGIILVAYDKNLGKSYKHSCLDKAQVNQNILNKLKQNGGIIYV